jgi:hypothetical protein
VIDLGPEAGERGGEVVATGRPEEIARVAASHTGRWLRTVLPALEESDSRRRSGRAAGTRVSRAV